MIGEVTNHLWQSTLVACAAGLLALALREERAEVRYWLWFSASIKFLLPFSILFTAGRHTGWIPAAPGAAATPPASLWMEQFAQPFPPGLAAAVSTGRAAVDWVALASFGVWVFGFTWIAWIRARGWGRVRAALRSSVLLETAAPVEVRSSPGLLEPGVVGLFRPVLLVPAGMLERLPAPQRAALMEHEFQHVRRRDNLSSAVHMIAEAVFWFHPLVWWIGARLLEERERACDEAVLRLGNAPQDYAEGILSVCKSYLESPLPCVSGVTGSNLKRRLQLILAGRIGRDLSFAKKLVLAGAGIAALALPVVVGSLSAPRMQAQSGTAADMPRFESASIRPCEAFRRNAPGSWPAENFRSQCTTVQRLIEQAYGLFETGHTNPGSRLRVTGGPAWASSGLYEIEANAQGPQRREMMNGPMLQGLLADRFKLKVHRETREIPVYALRVGGGELKLEPFQGSCVTRGFADAPSEMDCGTAQGYGDGFELRAATMADLCAGLLVFLDRPVLDETGMKGRFNFRVDLSTADPGVLRQPRSLPALSDPTVAAPPYVSFEAARQAMEGIGLNLKSENGPGEFMVIDQVERPSGR